MSRNRQSHRDSRESLTFSATMWPKGVVAPKSVDFFRLSRPVQDRFVAVTRGAAPPAPLLVGRAPRSSAWQFVGTSGALGLVAIVLLKAGWGVVGSRLALHGPVLRALDAVLLSAIAYGLVHAAAIWRASEWLPFRAGRYLFPGCVIEAHGPVLRVWSVADVEAVERLAVPSVGLVLRMRDGSRVVLPARTVAEVERAEVAVAALHPALMRALAEDDAQVLGELDPLHDGALSNPFGPTHPMRRVRSVWARFDWALAAGTGLLLAFAMITVRNSTSDDAMFRAVAHAASTPAYEQYLAQGGRYSEQVRDVLLPRAQLRDAEATGSVEAVRDVARAHPASRIQREIDDALRRVLVARFDDARASGTLGALDEFERRYPDSKLDAELRAARHALYDHALRGWKERAKPGPEAFAFMQRLFAWAEKSRSGTVEVRFQILPSRTLQQADAQVASSVHYPGPDALPSRYLTAEAMKSREERVALAVTRAFAQQFPSDVLSARAEERLPARAPAPIVVPTLVITYAPEWAYTTTSSGDPDTVFPGLSFPFRVTFAVPEGAPLAIQRQVWRIPEPWRAKAQDDDASREHYEQRVYDAMIDGAFAQLEKNVTGVLF